MPSSFISSTSNPAHPCFLHVSKMALLVLGLFAFMTFGACSNMLQQEDMGQLESELDVIKNNVVSQLQQQSKQLAAVKADNANQTMVFQDELQALK